MTERVSKIIARLQEAKRQFELLKIQGMMPEGIVHDLRRAFNQTKRYIETNISLQEAQNFASCWVEMEGLEQSLFSWAMGNIDECSAFLNSMINELKEHPDELITVADPPRSITNNKNVFIIHGHDKENLSRIETFLKDALKLNPVILGSQPNLSRALIEKLEKEGKSTSYAICLMTGDDRIKKDDGKEYYQPRPNVIFELGWFFATLGRERVCILEQQSVSRHTDVDGIATYRFTTSVEEQFDGIRKELNAVGLLGR